MYVMHSLVRRSITNARGKIQLSTRKMRVWNTRRQYLNVFALFVISLTIFYYIRTSTTWSSLVGEETVGKTLVTSKTVPNGKEIEDSKTQRKGPTLILLNTYMRSGSTILGSLLGHHDKAFYFYEPLQRTHTFKFINGSDVCNYYKPQCINGHRSGDRSLTMVSDIFTCRLRQHVRSFNPAIHFSGGHLGPKWKAYQTCKKQERSTMDGCLGVMETVCSKMPYRVIKSLRFSLSDAAGLFDKHPDLFIFQLFRDPRAIINSHLFTGWFPLQKNNIDGIRADAHVVCERLRNDIQAGRKLMLRYPDRLRLLQYEDFATNSSKIRTLYNLVGADKLENIEEFIQNKTNAKFDSSKHAKGSGPPVFPKMFSYRESLSFDIVRIIQNQCKDVIQQLGLKLFKTEEDMRNPDIKSIPGQLPFEIQT